MYDTSVRMNASVRECDARCLASLALQCTARRRVVARSTVNAIHAPSIDVLRVRPHNDKCTHLAHTRHAYRRSIGVAHAAYDSSSLECWMLMVGNEFDTDDRDITGTRCNQTMLSRMQIPVNFIHNLASKYYMFMLAIKSYCVRNLAKKSGRRFCLNPFCLARQR